MLVHRSAHARNFTVLPNAVLQDRQLSLAARGLLADLLSRPERWREDARQIADSSTDSRAAVRKALKELIEAGYYRVDTVRMPDGTIRSEAHVYDTPQIPGLQEAKVLLEAAKPQVEPSVPRPASGPAGSGDAGVLVVKNLVKETNLPVDSTEGQPADEAGDDRSEGRADDEPQVQHTPSPTDEEVRRAAVTLYQVLKPEPRLRLGGVEIMELAPLVAQWLERGSTTGDLSAALLPGLPAEMHSPVAVLRSRLQRKMPPVQTPEQLSAPRYHECAKCHDPVPQPGICRACAGLGAPMVRGGRSAETTLRGVALVRAAMRSAKGAARPSAVA